jgi:hypothetical protein
MADDNNRHITVRFYHGAVLNQAKTDAAGRRIYDDMEMVEAKYPGDPTRSNVAPAHDPCFMHRPRPGEDEGKGFLTWAERFPAEYKRFKENDPSAIRSGTPLNHAPFLSEARVFELRALNIHTVEALANLPDHLVTKNSLRSVVEQAKTWLDAAAGAALVAKATAERDALEARFAKLEAELAAAKAGKPADPVDAMDEAALREFLGNAGVQTRANASLDKLREAARSLMADA